MRRLLKEALFDIDADQQYVVHKLGILEFSDILYGALDDIFKDDKPPHIPAIHTAVSKITSFKFGEVRSDELTTELCMKVHQVIPITIQVVLSDDPSSVYNHKEINIHYDINAIMFMLKAKTKDAALAAMSKLSTLTKSATVYHEMSHWIDDAIHNQHLGKRTASLTKRVSDISKKYKNVSISPEIAKTIEKQIEWYKSGKYGNMIGHPIEINAEMYTLKSIKNDVINSLGVEEWDGLDFETISLLSGFDKKYYMISSESGQSYADMFATAWVKRAIREKLLSTSAINTYSSLVTKLRKVVVNKK